MLNAGVLRFDANGRIRNTVSAPTDFNGGTPTNQGLLCVVLSAAAPGGYAQGMGFETGGQMSAEGSPSTTIPLQGGLQQGSATRRTGVAVVGTIAGYVAGLPVSAAGLLVLATAEAVAGTGGFSSGFSSGFG